MNERGVTYLTMMAFVVIIGIASSAVGTQWMVLKKRDNEAELAFRGYRIKAAIEAFAADYETKKATRPNRYPTTLKQLTEKPKRYLQVVYKDPITGGDFELVKVGSEIRGVKSKSNDAPLDRVKFNKASRYSDIQFTAQAPTAGQQVCPQAAQQVNPLAPLAPCPTQPGGGPAVGPTPGPVPTPTP